MCWAEHATVTEASYETMKMGRMQQENTVCICSVEPRWRLLMKKWWWLSEP
jgi:hypothetical protein